MKSKKTTAHPLAQIAAELRSGKRDLQAYVAACCKRIDEWDGDIRAMLSEANRLQRLLGDVAGLASSGEIPPLFGTLIAVKDIFHVAGFEDAGGFWCAARGSHRARRWVYKGVAGGGCSGARQIGYD